ncbi:ABC transporter permease, partial [Frankia sp. CNm7]|nr:ABC transporter permease [Frankia nepalensis]
FFTGLTLLLIVVVAGVSSIGSGLAAGLLLGTAAVGSATGDDSARVTATVVGLAALALAANPNGLIPSVLRPAYEPVRRSPAVLAGSVGAITALWVLTLVDAVAPNVLPLGVLLVAVAAPLVARPLAGRAAATAGTEPAGRDEGLSGPLEWLGFDAPVGRADLDAIDARLALDTARLDTGPHLASGKTVGEARVGAA